MDMGALYYADAVMNFKAAGFTAIGLVLLFTVFRPIISVLLKIPGIGAILMFGVILMVLMFGLGCFFLIKSWGWTAEHQHIVTYVYFGIVYLIAQILVIKAFKS